MENVTAQKLKAYFLGTLGAEEAERLEETCALDAELTERAQIVETELADAYLRDALAADERRLFEENYLITESRREKLRLAENLWRVAAETAQTAAERSAPSFWQTLSGSQRRLAIGGLTAAMLIAAALVFVWLNSGRNAEIVNRQNINQSFNGNATIQNTETIRNDTADSRNATAGVNPANENLPRAGNANTPKPNTAPENKPTPKLLEPPVPMPATFILAPGTLRSEGEQFIKIAPNVGKINLRLTLPKDAVKYKTYRADLKTADGEIILPASDLKSLTLPVAAGKLENRTYMIFLEGRNAPEQPAEAIAEYTFRVRR